MLRSGLLMPASRSLGSQSCFRFRLQQQILQLHSLGVEIGWSTLPLGPAVLMDVYLSAPLPHGTDHLCATVDWHLTIQLAGKIHAFPAQDSRIAGDRATRFGILVKGEFTYAAAFRHVIEDKVHHFEFLTPEVDPFEFDHHFGDSERRIGCLIVAGGRGHFEHKERLQKTKGQMSYLLLKTAKEILGAHCGVIELQIAETW